MPPRFRRSEPMATFDLAPDDERDDHEDGLPLDEDDDGRPPRARVAARWRELSRRGRAVVAAATAVVVLAAATAVVLPGQLDARDQRLRAEAVRGLPGVVGDLSEPLTPTWRSAGDKVVMSLAGGALLASEGPSVRAVSASTGAELWAQDVGANPVCGPGPTSTLDLDRPVDVVVCLGGEPDDRKVTVLDASGAVVGTRALGVVGDLLEGSMSTPGPEPSPRAPLISPGPDGTIAVVEHTGDTTVPMPADAPAAATLRALREAGWSSPTMRVEDALTGEVLDQVTMHLRAQDLQECSYVHEEGGETEVQPFPSVFSSWSLVFFRVCGATVGASTDGRAKDLPDLAGWPQPLPEGGTVLVGGTSTYLDDEGAQVAAVGGWSMPPLVDDDPGGPLLSLAVDESTGTQGARLTATARDGERLWTSTVGALASTPSPALARLAGTVVAADDGRVVGLDAGSGTELWAADGVLEPESDGPGERVVGAVTDGTRLLLGISADAKAQLRLVALDVRDGSIAWERTHVTSVGMLAAVDGYPLLVSPSWTTAQGLG